MNTQTRFLSPDVYSTLSQTQCLRVSDGLIKPVLDGCSNASQLLVLIWSQLGDFDNLEYAWWLQREKEKLQNKGITIRAIGIGDSPKDDASRIATLGSNSVTILDFPRNGYS